MSQVRFELSQPKAGWMDIAVKDEDTTITFPVSYLCDPIYMLLKTFDILLTRERDCLIDKEYEWMPYPAIYFEGEGVDTYVTLADCETIVNVIKDNVYQSHSFLMDWEDVLKDVMNQLTDANMKIYCYDWYDNQAEADEIQILKEKVQELYTEVCLKRKKGEKVYAYENNDLDKYVIEDILFNLDESDKWIIKGNHINDNDSFERWCKTLLSDDIDLVDKLSNMCENEITEELVKLINSNKDKYYPRIEKYIKKHIVEYRDFIKSETSKLWTENLVDDICDCSSGLYNCDELYVRAIADALGFMWLVN